MSAFDKNGAYLPRKKIGKNNTKEKLIRQNDADRIKWNSAVSRVIVMKVPVTLLIAVKKTEITEPMRFMATVDYDEGSAMDVLTGIISIEVRTLSTFVDKVIRYHLKEKMKPESEQFYKALGDSRAKKEKTVLYLIDNYYLLLFKLFKFENIVYNEISVILVITLKKRLIIVSM